MREREERKREGKLEYGQRDGDMWSREKMGKEEKGGAYIIDKQV